MSREFNVGLVPYMMAGELVYGSLYLDDAVLLPEENHPNVLFNVRRLQGLRVHANREESTVEALLKLSEKLRTV